MPGGHSIPLGLVHEYEETRTVAQARRQGAIAEAYRTFNVKHAETVRQHREAYMAAKADWDAIRSTPGADGYEKARQAFIDASAPADHTQARAEMDRAIRAADAAFHDEVEKLAVLHGVTVR